MKSFVKITCFLFLILQFSISATAQSYDSIPFEDTLNLNVDIFEGLEPMLLTMEFDIKEYQKEKFKGKYMPVKMTYHINDSVERQRKVRLKARGQFRREHCSFPPFWLNIRKANISNEFLKNTTKIKLVNHCKNNKTYNNYILKEYLAYKIYNIITDYSFRVRLVKLKYIDTGRKNKEVEGWGFMIEPEEMMANRLNSIPIKIDYMKVSDTDSLFTDKATLFQYMIGNADYSVAGRHNMKLIKVQDINIPRLIPIPYDFDYSGLVNAHYAVPGEELGIENVQERYFLGACRSDKEYLKAIDFFIEKKEEIYSYINSFPYLDDKNKKEISSYLEEFYESTNFPKFIEREFRPTCR